MIIQSLWRANSVASTGSAMVAASGRKICYGIDMGAPSDEIVAIRLGQNRGDPSVITINCPDQLGLGCDVSRIIFEFGLRVVRLDLSTDGRWCFAIFWVTPISGSPSPIKWAMLKKRLVAICPSTRAPMLLPLIAQPRRRDIFILQVCALSHSGLLNDIAQTLWELEVVIHRGKLATTPEGKAVGLFYVTDIRNMLQNEKRKEDICSQITTALGVSSSSCTITLAGPEWGGLDCAPTSNLPPVVGNLLVESLPELESALRSMGRQGSNLPSASVSTDNSLSPGHTLLQISCKHRKALLYDVMRTLKDLGIQIAYGRLSLLPNGNVEIDLFILQADLKKIIDPQRQNTLSSCLQMEVLHPIRVVVINRGPDTELLVATPIEVNGCGRPQVLSDVTRVLRSLEICIFKVDMGRHLISNRQWEIYHFLLIESSEQTLTDSHTRFHIAEQVRSVLIG
eukprot:c24410_g1_i4 orf=284-1642(+)